LEILVSSKNIIRKKGRKGLYRMKPKRPGAPDDASSSRVIFRKRLEGSDVGTLNFR